MENKQEIQYEIIRKLKVLTEFDARNEANKRILFIKNYLISSRLKTLVLGISGGIDSTVLGRLAQLSVEELRKEGFPCHFIAVRLPYGRQLDENDAEEALKFIKPDKILNINIKKACDETLSSLLESGHIFDSAKQQDFVLGNIKARQRMLIQYAIAGTNQGLVLGTDQAAEALMGFFTKYGDGACDLAPLYGLIKRQVKKIGEYLEAPEALVNKKPTADLESLRPLLLDEDVYGVTYQEIDNFLEGKITSTDVFDKILKAYSNSEHKRNLPLSLE